MGHGTRWSLSPRLRPLIPARRPGDAGRQRRSSFRRPPSACAVRLALFALVLAVVSTGCSRPPTGLAAEVPGSSWTVERVVLADGTVVRGDGDRVTFAPDGALTLSSCNVCNGRYAVREDVLTVEEPLACTRAGCAPGAVELERYLGSTATLRRDGAYLVAESEGAQVLLVPAGDR